MQVQTPGPTICFLCAARRSSTPSGGTELSGLRGTFYHCWRDALSRHVHHRVRSPTHLFPKRASINIVAFVFLKLTWRVRYVGKEHHKTTRSPRKASPLQHFHLLAGVLPNSILSGHTLKLKCPNSRVILPSRFILSPPSVSKTLRKQKDSNPTTSACAFRVYPSLSLIWLNTWGFIFFDPKLAGCSPGGSKVVDHRNSFSPQSLPSATSGHPHSANCGR